MRAGLLSCSVQPSSGRWRSVWPWTPGGDHVRRGRVRRRQGGGDRVRVGVGQRIGGAHRARELVVARHAAAPAARRRGRAQTERALPRAATQGLAVPEAKSATTASTPSMLVPDITPTKIWRMTAMACNALVVRSELRARECPREHELRRQPAPSARRTPPGARGRAIRPTATRPSADCAARRPREIRSGDAAPSPSRSGRHSRSLHPASRARPCAPAARTATDARKGS